MELSQLKTLIHVAELGSLSKAADRLNVVQPALSRQIRLLEAELGSTLFERHGRGMLLTDAGKIVLERAIRVMEEIDAMRSAASSSSRRLKGQVVIGMPPTVAEVLSVPLVARIREEHPDLTIRISSAFSGHVMDWLQRGELEVAVLYDPSPQRSLRTEPILVEDLLFVSSGTSPVRGTAIRFADAARQPLILPSPRHGLRKLLDFYAYRSNVELAATIEAESLTIMVDLVKKGFGCTILPLAPIYPAVRSGELSVCPITNPVPTRKLVLSFPLGRRVSPAARFVGDAILDIARHLVGDGVWSGHMKPSSKQSSRSRLSRKL